MRQMCRLLIVVNFLFNVASAVIVEAVATVSVSPASVQSPAVGRQLTISLKIANGVNVAGYQATVVFDTTALRYVTSAKGNYLPADALFFPSVSGNQVTLVATTLVGESNGAGTLATVTFEVIAVKASTLRLTGVLLSDGEGNASRPQVKNGQINAPVVPGVNKPDLVVQSPRVSKSTLSPSESFTLSAIVVNGSSRRAPGTMLRYYRSTDSTISKSDTQVGTDAVSIPSGFNFKRESITLNAPSAPGTYYYGACVDTVPNEADTTNNCSTAVSVTVVSATINKPDLVVQSPHVSKRILSPGESFTLSATVRNRGSGRAAATTLRYYRSINNTISRSDTQVGTGAIGFGGLASITLNAPLTPGTYYYGACVDTVPNEADTTNNCSTAISVIVQSKRVTIPDTNLRAAIEKALRKASGATITTADMARLTTLNARNANIRVLTGLEHATNLRRLDLGGVWGNNSNSVSDISAVAGLTNLTRLSLSDNNISDISAVARLINLIHLSLGGNNVSNISALTRLTNLTYLSLYNNNISNISALTRLTSLTDLSLRNNTISDISSVARLTNLRRLHLGGNNISDISPLVSNRGLGQGDEVDVRGNPLNAVSVNTHIPTLQRRRVEVKFDPPQTVNIPDTNLRAAIEKELGKASGATITTADMARLTRLHAPNASIRVLIGLEHATNLKYLNLGGNTISDISVVSGLTHLTRLYLGGNTIPDISALTDLTNLTQLGLYNSKIVDISPLVSNTGLGRGDAVNVRGNPLNAVSINTHIPTLQRRGVNVQFDPPQAVNIPDVKLRAAIEKELGKASGATITTADMANLTRLFSAAFGVQEANIRNLTGLEHATNLTDLRLEFNSISNISAVSRLNNLTRLELGYNTISDLSPLSDLTNLTVLLLWDNSISDISAVSRLTNLTGLYLQDNTISDLSPLVLNTGLGQGDLVNVKGNPLNAASINTHIPTLQRRGVTVEFDSPQDVSIDGTVDVLIYMGDVSWIEPHEATVEAETTKHLLQSAGIQAEITQNENAVKQWMLQTNSDSSVDVLIIYGILPTTIYPPENVMPEGSVAERWIETSDGNTILNHADYLGFQSTVWRNNPQGPGVAGHLNQAAALQNLMDTLGIFISVERDNISMFVTPEGRTLTPSLVDFRSDRPFPLNQLEGNWFAEKILASNTGNAQATLADPVVLRDGNRGRIAIVHQTELEDNPKGEVAAEIIINYLMDESAPLPVPDEDVNRDGVVDAKDLGLVIASLGQKGQNVADVNGDGVVDNQDIILVAAAFDAVGAAAPSLHSLETLEGLTAAEVQHLLTQARHKALTDPTYLRGIAVLEQLLALLLPKETALLPNYPNPFNPETWIPYHLSNASDVAITIYDVRGVVVRRLALGHQQAGYYTDRSRTAYWDGRNQVGEPVASGVYFYTLTLGDFTATRKMLIRK